MEGGSSATLLIMETTTNRERILLLHPSADTLRAMSQALGDHPDSVFCAHRATDALSVSAADMTVVSSLFPGWEDVVAQLRHRNPALLLIVHADSLESVASAVNRIGPDWLTSGTETDELAVSVRQVFDRPRPDRITLERLVESRTRALQQIKDQWEQSFDAVQDPMAVLTPDYRVVRANRAYAAHLGRDIVQVPGKYCYELRTLSRNRYPLTDQGLCASCPAAAARETGAAASANITDQQDRRWVVSAYPVRTEVAGTVICHYRDVTSEMQRLGQIAIADKLASVGKLAGAVAHELNSPMTSIMVFSEALAQKAEAESVFYQHAVEINEAARRCRRLIQGLLRFARRPQSQQATTVRVSDVWAEMQPLVRHRIDILGASLEVSLPDDLPAVPVVVADLEHVLIALVTNATEACSKGDRIRLEGQVLPRARLLQITVSDTGRGMSAEELAQAMDPFFTTKPATQASGLGLTTVEAVLSEMGATIRLESEAGKGTSAYVCLPLAEEGL